MTIDYTPQPYDMLLDASALSDLRCARLFQFKILWGFRPPKSEYLIMGSCTHKLIEMYSTNRLPTNPLALLEIFSKRGLDMEKYLPKLLATAGSLRTWGFHPIISDVDGTPAVEYRFLIRYGTLDKLTIFLAGTIDRIEEFPGLPGVVYVSDWKTTAKPHKGPWVADEFSKTLQLYFYLYVLKHYLQPKFPNITGAVARILAIHYNAMPVAIQPSGNVELLPHVEESIPKMLEDSVLKVQSILDLGEEIAYPEGLLYGTCARCDFQNLCAMKNTRVIQQELNCQFRQETYNPLKHGDDDAQ